MEPLDVRIERTRKFLEFFRPGLVYDFVPIDDVYGPTAVDANIHALVVSKETLGGAAASTFPSSLVTHKSLQMPEFLTNAIVFLFL